MSVISAGTTVGTALVNSGDTTGQLIFKTNGSTTAVTIDTSQNVSVVGNLTFNNGQSAVSTGKAIAMAIVFGG